MDRLPLLVGTLIGCLFGAAVATVYFMRSARSASQVITETDERQTELASAQQDAASAKATLVSVREQLSDMRTQVEKERQRAERESTLRSTTQQELRGVQERIAEREKSIVELRTVIEQSKTALTDTFKATGADVLRQTAESLIQQAREQFQGQYTLSQQDLEARQRSIDATLAPIREQLVKNEQ